MREGVEEILLSVMNDYTGNSESNLPDATNNMMNLFNSQLQSVFKEIDSCQTGDSDQLVKGFDWNKYADIRQKYCNSEEEK